MVTRLDRLARSTRDLLNTLDTIAKAGAGFRSLGDAWADTMTAHGRLMLTFQKRAAFGSTRILRS
jgi:DNA invertase Pin-like site-specific DNA recombinase